MDRQNERHGNSQAWNHASRGGQASALPQDAAGLKPLAPLRAIADDAPPLAAAPPAAPSPLPQGMKPAQLQPLPQAPATLAPQTAAQPAQYAPQSAQPAQYEPQTAAQPAQYMPQTAAQHAQYMPQTAAQSTQYAPQSAQSAQYEPQTVAQPAQYAPQSAQSAQYEPQTVAQPAQYMPQTAAQPAQPVSGAHTRRVWSQTVAQPQPQQLTPMQPPTPPQGFAATQRPLPPDTTPRPAFVPHAVASVSSVRQPANVSPAAKADSVPQAAADPAGTRRRRVAAHAEREAAFAALPATNAANTAAPQATEQRTPAPQAPEHQPSMPQAPTLQTLMPQVPAQQQTAPPMPAQQPLAPRTPAQQPALYQADATRQPAPPMPAQHAQTRKEAQAPLPHARQVAAVSATGGLQPAKPLAQAQGKANPPPAVKARMAVPTPAAPALSMQNEPDALDEDSARYPVVEHTPLAEPMPVPTHSPYPERRSGKRRGWLVVVAVLAALGVTVGILAVTGVLGRLSGTAGGAQTANGSVATTDGAKVDAATVAEVTGTPELSSVTVEPAETTAPAVLTFTLQTNTATSSVRLLTEDGSTIYTTAFASPKDEGREWKVTATLDTPYTGAVRVFLRDAAGKWSVGEQTCEVNVR